MENTEFEKVERELIEKHDGAFTYSQEESFWETYTSEVCDSLMLLEKNYLFPYYVMKTFKTTTQIKVIGTGHDVMRFIEAMSKSPLCNVALMYIRSTDMLVSALHINNQALERHGLSSEKAKDLNLCVEDNMPKDLQDYISNFRTGFSSELLTKVAERNEMLGNKWSLDIKLLTIAIMGTGDYLRESIKHLDEKTKEEARILMFNNSIKEVIGIYNPDSSN